MTKHIELLKNYSAKRILDVGTGRGEFLKVIEEGFSEYNELVGIDIKDTGFELAREGLKNSEKVQLLVMNSDEMTFEDNSFDAVCISNSLHHLPVDTNTLNEMKRVLKPDGLLIINEMYCDNQTKEQMGHVTIHHYMGMIDTLTGIVHRTTYKKNDIIKLAENNGLEILATEEKIDDRKEFKVKEELNMLTAAVDRSLERIKERPEYRTMRLVAKDVKEKLLKDGIQGATQLLLVCKLV